MQVKLVIITCGVLLAIAFSEPSCKFDNLEELQADSFCDTSSIKSYQNDVVPILSGYCYRCHGISIYQALGNGYLLEGYAPLMTFVNNGQLVCAIEHTNCANAKPMPKDSPKLDDSYISTISTWVCQGAPDN